MGILWSKVGALEFDNNGNPATGALARFYVGGTTTPLVTYEDAGEGTPSSFPVEADGDGRWPVTFIPYCTSYDVKVTTSGGTLLYYPTEIPNPDPVEAAAQSVTADQLIATGHVHWEPIDGTKAGFVRCNGRTLGNAASGATERANADTVTLFTYLYNAMANGQAAVSGGRGANAAADYAANKTINLPDLRAGATMGLDTMGNSASSGYPAIVPFSQGNSTTPGSAPGNNTHTLTTAQLASHTHAITALATTSSGSHTHTITDTRVWRGRVNATAAGSESSAATEPTTAVGVTDTQVVTVQSGTVTNSTDGAHTHTTTGTSDGNGNGDAHNNVPFAVIGSFFIKL